MVWDARVQGRRRVAGVEPADLTAIYRSNRRLRTGHPHTSSSPRTFKRRLRSLNNEAPCGVGFRPPCVGDVSSKGRRTRTEVTVRRAPGRWSCTIPENKIARRVLIQTGIEVTVRLRTGNRGVDGSTPDQVGAITFGWGCPRSKSATVRTCAPITLPPECRAGRTRTCTPRSRFEVTGACAPGTTKPMDGNTGDQNAATVFSCAASASSATTATFLSNVDPSQSRPWTVTGP
jgi:hypothetical protein